MRGGTADYHGDYVIGGISIHPPRAGRDVKSCQSMYRNGYFNPPAPCGAGQNKLKFTVTFQKFQSTRPVRGGTLMLFVVTCLSHYFNPPAPCGAGLSVIPLDLAYIVFQSTRPVRGDRKSVV